jgi:CBS domain containing-hemolysin-like protein
MDAVEMAPLLADVSMSRDALLLLVYVLLALIFSFLCSLAEASLLSMTPSYIAGLREHDPRKAERLRLLKEVNIDRSLAAILTVNTIAHTVGAIGAGSKATAVFGEVWFGVFSAAMTLAILFLTEIVPKTVGALYWRQLAGFTSMYVNVLIKTMYPLIVVSEKLTQLISRGRKPEGFSREEFVAMAGLGHDQGMLNEREAKIIRNLFALKSLTASDVMTPAIVVSAWRQDLTVREALSDTSRMPFSRMPIYENGLDNITGFVLREELLTAQSRGQEEARLRDFRRDIVAVLASTSLSSVMETLLRERQHIAIVVGEYGDTKGLVTLEDVVETLLGIEIVDEGDRIEDMQQLARDLWSRRARRLGLSAGATRRP